MKTKYRTVINDIPELKGKLKNINKKRVEIGAFNGSHAYLASIHEYGCNIKVTDKIRAYLHSQGLHLKASTKYIKIPERSFLRATFDEQNDEILKKCEKALSQVIAGKMSVDTFLDMYGRTFATAIKKYMRDLDKPENHPYTKDKKGSSNPLVDTGNLIESISWKVE